MFNSWRFYKFFKVALLNFLWAQALVSIDEINDIFWVRESRVYSCWIKITFSVTDWRLSIGKERASKLGIYTSSLTCLDFKVYNFARREILGSIWSYYGSSKIKLNLFSLWHIASTFGLHSTSLIKLNLTTIMHFLQPIIVSGLWSILVGSLKNYLIQFVVSSSEYSWFLHLFVASVQGLVTFVEKSGCWLRLTIGFLHCFCISIEVQNISIHGRIIDTWFSCMGSIDKMTRFATFNHFWLDNFSSLSS